MMKHKTKSLRGWPDADAGIFHLLSGLCGVLGSGDPWGLDGLRFGWFDSDFGDLEWNLLSLGDLFTKKSYKQTRKPEDVE